MSILPAIMLVICGPRSTFAQKAKPSRYRRGPTVVTMHSRPHPVTDALRAHTDLRLEVIRENRRHLVAQLHEHLSRMS